MVYGYAKCSTDETRQDINRQVRELKASGATDGTIYLEYQSGTKSDRVELAKVLSLLKPVDRSLSLAISSHKILDIHAVSSTPNKRLLSILSTQPYPNLAPRHVPMNWQNHIIQVFSP